MRVKITLEAEFHNTNPPHVYDPTADELRETMQRVVSDRADQTIWLTQDAGFFQRDLFPHVQTAVEVLPD